MGKDKHGDRQGGGRWLDRADSAPAAELRLALDEAARRDPDEVALRRIWAKVADLPAELPAAADPSEVASGRAQARRRSRWPWLAATTLLGAAAASALLLGTRAEAPRVGDGHIQVAGSGETHGPRPSVVGPATVRTGLGETLRLALRGGAEATISAESALVLGADEQPSVAAGEVNFRVPPQPAGQTFSVGAGAYRIAVVGTRFRVRIGSAAGAPVDVAVAEGTVEIWNQTERLARVPAGSSWTGVGSTDPAAAAEEAPEMAPAAKAVLSNPAGPAAGGGGPGQRPGSGDLALQIQARAARDAGQSRRALVLYRLLARRGGAAGENAEYEIGKLLRDSLRQPRQAIAAWRGYRTRHPHGLLRVEADVSIVETLLALDDKDGALGESVDFVKRHPDNERRLEMIRLAADLQREQGGRPRR